jgi:hypothetical protein
MSEKRNFKRKERGQSLTELAISFMLVMLIFSGAVDFGRAYFALVALRDAAQEGVIYASVYPHDQAGIISRVHNSSTTPVDMATTTVNITYGPDSEGFAADGSDACAGFTDTGVDSDGMGPTDVISNFVIVEVVSVFDFTMPFITAIIGSETIDLSVEQTHTILSPGC